MSEATITISPERFRAALEDLPAPNLYSKAAEILNSMIHLKSSNDQLQEFADAGDADCAEAIEENIVVMERMSNRLDMLKEEVEGRGLRWVDEMIKSPLSNHEPNGVPNAQEEGTAQVANRDQSDDINQHTSNNSIITSGTLTDDELARRVMQQMGDEDDDDGVHL